MEVNLNVRLPEIQVNKLYHESSLLKLPLSINISYVNLPHHDTPSTKTTHMMALGLHLLLKFLLLERQARAVMFYC